MHTSFQPLTSRDVHAVADWRVNSFWRWAFNTAVYASLYPASDAPGQLNEQIIKSLIDIHRT
jgi:hypothetical protein